MHHATVIVLAGGKSSRMGADKRFVRMPDGRNLLTVAIEKARRVSTRVILSVAPGDTVSYVRGVELVQDEASALGPLSGLLSSLKRMKTRKAAVIPCDVPFLAVGLLSYLLRVSKGFDVAIPVWRQHQPLVGVYSKQVLPHLYQAITYGQLSIHMLLEDERLSVLRVRREELEEFGEPRMMFLNINTRKDLLRARRLSRRVSWKY